MIATTLLLVLTLAQGGAAQALPIADGQTIPLWNGRAPGAQGDTEADVPAVTVFLPRTMAPGTPAVVICPGGSYARLA
jgi:hypothetical protein